MRIAMDRFGKLKDPMLNAGILTKQASSDVLG